MKLLCQLWALNESLQDYKKTLEDEDHQREVASILEAHLEDEEEELEDELEDVEANEETSWPQNNANTNRSNQQGTSFFCGIEWKNIDVLNQENDTCLN